MGEAYDTCVAIKMLTCDDDFLVYLSDRFSKSVNISEAMAGYIAFKEKHKSIVLDPKIKPFTVKP